jgi:hypothetical protein
VEAQVEARARPIVAAAIALLCLGAIGAVQAGLAGARFMFDLEQARPALVRFAPTVNPPGTPRLARRVVVAILDGLRLDRSYQLPYLDELRRRGIDAEASSHYPTWSRPNYVSILTGVPPSASGVRTNHHSTPVQLDALMDRVHAAGLRVASATDYDVLPSLFLRPRSADSAARAELDDIDIDVLHETMNDRRTVAALRASDADLVSPFDDARYAPWPGGLRQAGAELVAGDADLIVLLVGAVDAAGHAHGADSVEYRAAAEIVDRTLARALAGLDLSQDAVVVVADHGHTGRGGHGGVEPEVLAVPLVLAGAGVRAGATVATAAGDARLIDVAPTVAALLGVPAPGHGLGRTLTELLMLSPEDAARRVAADQLRLTANRAIVGAAEATAAGDVLEHRAARIAVVLAGAALALALALLLVRRHVMRLEPRVLLATVPAFFVVYYALIGVVGQRFSPSLLPAEAHLAGELVKYGVVGMAVQLVASWHALRGHRVLAERLAEANGIAWVGLMLTMLPAGLVWAFFPPPYVSLPGPTWLVLIPAVQVAVACAAVNVALTLLIELIVFAARAVDPRRAVA